MRKIAAFATAFSMVAAFFTAIGLAGWWLANHPELADAAFAGIVTIITVSLLTLTMMDPADHLLQKMRMKRDRRRWERRNRR